MEKEFLIIAKQGMFSAGGIVLKSEGVFNSEDQFEETGAGQTSHADHANVFIKFQLRKQDCRSYFCMDMDNLVWDG